jgi:hypothetical protein
MLGSPAEAMGFLIVNSGAVLVEAVNYSYVCLHTQFQSTLLLVPAVKLINFALCLNL